MLPQAARTPGQTVLEVERRIPALFNFEGISLRCTLKTEQRRKKSKATEGAAISEGIAAQVNSIVETFNHKGKYNFVNRTSVETCIIQENQA